MCVLPQETSSAGFAERCVLMPGAGGSRAEIWQPFPHLLQDRQDHPPLSGKRARGEGSFIVFDEHLAAS